MRAILVAVDYMDMVKVTIPYNRHHFTDMMIVTCYRNKDELKTFAKQNDCILYATNAFYGEGAIFNKWKALEEALDAYGRYDWMCLMDADILWPKDIGSWHPSLGCLHVPRRRVFEDVTKPIPQEPDWHSFSLPMKDEEFAGYSQIFHCADTHVGPAPWHETNWVHAGGADSFFWQKWPKSQRFRPPFEVLHLGPIGLNWCGRATPLLGGGMPAEATERIRVLQALKAQRRGQGPSRYQKERIP